jgi:hypothetical protein
MAHEQQEIGVIECVKRLCREKRVGGFGDDGHSA